MKRSGTQQRDHNTWSWLHTFKMDYKRASSSVTRSICGFVFHICRAEGKSVSWVLIRSHFHNCHIVGKFWWGPTYSFAVTRCGFIYTVWAIVCFWRLFVWCGQREETTSQLDTKSTLFIFSKKDRVYMNKWIDKWQIKKKIAGQKFKNEFSWSKKKKKKKKEKEKAVQCDQKKKATTSNTSLMNQLSLL